MIIHPNAEIKGYHSRIPKPAYDLTQRMTFFLSKPRVQLAPAIESAIV
jgi:hypothetical protein